MHFAPSLCALLPLLVEFSLASDYEVIASVRIEGNGQRYTAGIVVPTDWPEQKVELLEEKAHNATGRVEKVGEGGAMLIVRTSAVPAGQYAEVIHRYRVHVDPVAPGLSRDDFPDNVSPNRAMSDYLKPSPGIESRDDSIVKLSKELSESAPHPWDYAHAAFDWAHKEIRYQEGDYTSAAAAVANHVGDCEEKASVFIALCRARGIPARTVWVPKHCWAEFYLVDNAGNGHWIPAHTSGPAWFGQMRSANVILQKGDNFRPPQKTGKPSRLLAPWLRGLSPEPDWEHKLEVRPMEEPKATNREDLQDRERQSGQ